MERYMKKIYTSRDNIIINQLKDILESNGIHCVIKNELLAPLAGLLPPAEVWPELWILDDAKEAEAREIFKNTLTESKNNPWECPGCGEKIEGQFSECWRCGENRTNNQNHITHRST